MANRSQKPLSKASTFSATSLVSSRSPLASLSRSINWSRAATSPRLLAVRSSLPLALQHVDEPVCGCLPVHAARCCCCAAHLSTGAFHNLGTCKEGHTWGTLALGQSTCCILALVCGLTIDLSCLPKSLLGSAIGSPVGLLEPARTCQVKCHQDRAFPGEL